MSMKFKIQNSKFKINPKHKFWYLLFVLCISFVICTLSFVIRDIYAQEVTIFYTGETHSMLYPCNCPKEPDGGIARRISLVKELRKKYPRALLLDSGNFFAGGMTDEYTQNTQLDMQRTQIQLKAMRMLKYDAVAVGDAEFNFGREFLSGVIKQYSDFNFLSSNAKLSDTRPYVVKEVSGVKIGIIGLTGMEAKQKAGGIEFTDVKSSISRAVKELREKKAEVIIVLGNISTDEDLTFIKDTLRVDILVSNYRNDKGKKQPYVQLADTLLLIPSREGRRLGKISFQVKGGKVTDFKIEEIRLADKIKDAPEVLSILPACFSDLNCKRPGGVTGICENGAGDKARCVFNPVNKIKLTVITKKDCAVCQPEPVIASLKQGLAGLEVDYLYYPDSRAKKIMDNFELFGLPVYLLGLEVEKEKNFAGLKGNLEDRGEYYLLKPEVSGVGYFINRQKEKERFDLFISLYDQDAKKILDTVKEFHPVTHFVVSQNQGDIEECSRAVCVQEYYPQYFWDYLTCRAANINSSWWEDCAINFNSDRIKTCAKSKEAEALLKENTKLNTELRITYSPAYLWQNQEVFSSKGAPDKEELKRVLKKR